MGRSDDIFAQATSRGEAAIDEFIATRQSEELFLDFKRSADNGGGERLAAGDRENLGRAISGFGNAEGGVIIWGVDCRPDRERGDVPGGKVPIRNPTRFKSWLEGVVSGLTVPPHPAVTHVVIERANDEGFVVTHIAKSYLAPHQCVRPQQYYMRVGSNFEPIPHGVLAGMFGRPPQPVVFHMWSAPPAILRADGAATFEVGLLLTNRSSAIARDLYVNVTIHSPSGSTISVVPTNDGNWVGTHVFGFITQMVTRDGYKLAPCQVIQPLRIEFALRAPFSEDLFLKITLGCFASPIKEFTNRIDQQMLRNLYEEFRRNSDDRAAAHDFVSRIVGGGVENIYTESP